MSNRKEIPEFPVGTVCEIVGGSYKTGQRVTVCEWDLFEEEFSETAATGYVPVMEMDGKINGWYPQNLHKIGYIDPKDVKDDEPKQETIEI